MSIRKVNANIIDVTKRHYQTNLLTIFNFIPHSYFEAFEQADAHFDKKRQAAAFVEAAEEVLNMERQRCAPYMLNPGALKVVNMDECGLADMLKINYGTFDNKLIAVHHNLFKLFKDYDPKFDEKQARTFWQSIAEIQKNVGNHLQKYGIAIGDKVYKYLVSSSSHLKAGKSLFIRTDVYEEHKEELHFFRAKDQLDRGISPVEYNKVLATLLSGSVPTSRIPGCDKITLDDVIIVKDFDFDLEYQNVMKVTSDARIERYPSMKVKTTIADGQAISLGALPESCQGRGGTSKYAAINITRPELPAFIKDYQGIERPSKDVKIIMSESCVKGLKWFESLDDWRETFKRMGLEELRICAFASKEEEMSRNLSRQALQELVFANDEDLYALGAFGAHRVAKLKTLDGAMNFLQEVWKKDEAELSGTAKFFRAYPEFIGNEDVVEYMYQTARSKYCEAMVSPTIPNSHYEYVLIDPYALLDVWVYGKDPTTEKIGRFKSADTVSVAGIKDKGEIYGIRHPANLINARVLDVENPEGFEASGNVMILPWNNTVLTGYWDGDNDGDEAFWSSNKRLVELMSRVVNKVDPPCVIFDHDKAAKGAVPSAAEWRKQTTKMLIDAQRYNRVGVYSNLCTKVLNDIRIGMSKTEIDSIIEIAAIPHVLTILILDFIKTGVLPSDLIDVASKIGDRYKQMPHNQRYARHDIMPFDLKDWDDMTLPLSDSIVDRLTVQMDKIIGGPVEKLNVENIKYDWTVAMPGGSSKNVPAARQDYLNPVSVNRLNMFLGKEMFKFDEKISIYYLAHTLFYGMNELIRNAGDNKGNYRECVESAYVIVREEVLNFMRISVNNIKEKSDDELLGIAAAMLLRQHVNHKNVDQSEAQRMRYLMFIIDCFGDVLANNKKEGE